MINGARIHRSGRLIQGAVRLNSTSSISRFQHVKAAPADPILSLTSTYQADANPNKINLGVGAYRDSQGLPWILPSVKEASERVHQALMTNKVNYEYTPILGSKSYRDTVQQFIFKHRTMKTSSELVEQGRVLTMQGLSGTGSLRVIGEFLAKFSDNFEIKVPDPTWANHIQIFENCNIKVGKYRYYDSKSKGLDLDGFLQDLKGLKEGTGVLLHVCCHNPTGVDPTIEQWTQIIDAIVERQLIPVLDMAYQGFGSGLEEDLQVIELFSQRVLSNQLGNFLLAQSWAKNMGLYGERVGSFSFVGGSKSELDNVESQFKRIARPMYSSPPSTSARIVETVLSDAKLKGQWLEDVDVMADRLRDMRRLLFDELDALNVKGPGSGLTGWEHLLEQRGMFCFTGLTPQQVDSMIDQSVYMTKNGRISIAGINESNVKTLANALSNAIALH